MTEVVDLVVVILVRIRFCGRAFLVTRVARFLTPIAPSLPCPRAPLAPNLFFSLKLYPYAVLPALILLQCMRNQERARRARLYLEMKFSWTPQEKLLWSSHFATGPQTSRTAPKLAWSQSSRCSASATYSPWSWVAQHSDVYYWTIDPDLNSTYLFLLELHIA